MIYLKPRRGNVASITSNIEIAAQISGSRKRKSIALRRSKNSSGRSIYFQNLPKPSGLFSNIEGYKSNQQNTNATELNLKLQKRQRTRSDPQSEFFPQSEYKFCACVLWSFCAFSHSRYVHYFVLLLYICVGSGSSLKRNFAGSSVSVIELFGFLLWNFEKYFEIQFVVMLIKFLGFWLTNFSDKLSKGSIILL